MLHNFRNRLLFVGPPTKYGIFYLTQWDKIFILKICWRYLYKIENNLCFQSIFHLDFFHLNFFSFWDLKPWKKCIILVSISHLQWHVYRLILKLQFAFWKMTFKLNIGISFKDFVKHFTPTHRTICKALKSMHLTKLISQLWSKNVFYHIFNIHLQMTYYRLHIYSNKTLFY